MISNTEKLQIRQLLQDPRWKTVERLVELEVGIIRDMPTVVDSEWDTLKNTLTHEGQISGIRNFIKRLYALAQDV